MRYPVNNFKTEWNGTAGYGYGDITSYGFHDGVDINDNQGGNSDLGKPLFAIAKGKVVSLHQHTSGSNFGKHFYIQIDGSWGMRYVHYAHCNEIFVVVGQEVTEGQKIATVGNSGTVYAHCHFALKKKANGMDTIATSKAILDDNWEDPIKFIEKYMAPAPTPDLQKQLDQMRKERDDNHNLYQQALKDKKASETALQGQIDTLKNRLDRIKTIANE